MINNGGEHLIHDSSQGSRGVIDFPSDWFQFSNWDMRNSFVCENRKLHGELVEQDRPIASKQKADEWVKIVLCRVTKNTFMPFFIYELRFYFESKTKEEKFSSEVNEDDMKTLKEEKTVWISSMRDSYHWHDKRNHESFSLQLGKFCRVWRCCKLYVEFIKRFETEVVDNTLKISILFWYLCDHRSGLSFQIILLPVFIFPFINFFNFDSILQLSVMLFRRWISVNCCHRGMMAFDCQNKNNSLDSEKKNVEKSYELYCEFSMNRTSEVNKTRHEMWEHFHHFLRLVFPSSFFVGQNCAVWRWWRSIN